MLLNLQPYFATYKDTEITEEKPLLSSAPDTGMSALKLFSVSSVISVAKKVFNSTIL